MWAGFLEPRGPDRNGLVAQLRFRVDHKLVEKGVGGLVSFVEEGHPSCSMLSLGGLVLGNVDGDLKKPRAPGGMDVNLERSIDEEILSVASTVEAIVAPVADESLWEEASRYSSLVPRSLHSCGGRDSPSFFGGNKAMVVADLGFGALDGLADEDELTH